MTIVDLHVSGLPTLYRPCWLQTYNFSYDIVSSNPPHLFGPCWLQTYSLISVFVQSPHVFLALLVANLQSDIILFNPHTCLALFVANLQPHIVFVRSLHLFRPWWLQTYSLMSFLFNPQTCFGPVGCKPTASYLLLSIPTCVLVLLVANLQSWIYCFQSAHLFGPCWLQTYSLILSVFVFLALLVANLQSDIYCFQSPHLFGPCWLQTYSLISVFFNPHMCFWPCWSQTYSLISIAFNPRTCLGPAGCKPTASCRFCSIPTLVRALLVANLQPHVVFVQSPHLFGPCWLQTYSLISVLFNPHMCFGPVGCKPTV